jgi:hypothetical protein
MADDFGSHYSEDYDENSENDGNMDFEFSDVEAEIEDEDIDPPFEVDGDSKTTEKIPDYFLKEINLI